MSKKMAQRIKSLGITTCSVVFKGPLRKSFSRVMLFSLIKNSRIKIQKIVTDAAIRFGGCKLSKRSRK